MDIPDQASSVDRSRASGSSIGRSRLAAAAAAVVSLAIVASVLFLRLPYVIEQPGPTFDTLGETNGTQLISIEGAPEYHNAGQLELTTVLVSGGPDSGISVFELVPALFQQAMTVYPEEAVYQAGTSREQADTTNRERMESSQDNAIAAALKEQGIAFSEQAKVVEVLPDGASNGKLQASDQIVAINGKKVGSIEQARSDIQALGVGGAADVQVLRDGASQNEKITVAEGADGNPGIGVLLQPVYDFPFEVTIKLDDVGGSSAGLMFALGIIDRMTEGGIAHGKRIAGTGTISADGQVGPIGGIRQKMVGARNSGAEWFLIPADNCTEAVGHVPEGLNTAKVSSLSDAKTVLEAIGRGEGQDQVPQCEADQKSVG